MRWRIYGRGLTDPTPTQGPTISTMNHLVSSGFIRSRLEATHLGIALGAACAFDEWAGSDGDWGGDRVVSSLCRGGGRWRRAHFANLLSPTPQVAEAI